MKIVFTQEQVEEIVLNYVKQTYDEDVKYVKVNTYSEDFVVTSDERFKKD